MSASELLASLRAAGITVEAEGGRLRVGGAAGSITPELRERLAAEKMALLDLLQAEAGPSLTPRRRDLPAPLSHFQERLWVIQQLDPGGTEYNMATAWDLGAGVAAGRLHAALGAVIARHDILRTTFHETPTHPEARVGPPDIVPISRGDLSAVAPEARFAAVGEDLDRQVRRPFELAREAPVRFGVYDCGADGAALLIVAHHIAFDHWSLALFRQALETALADPASLPEPAVQYADYAAWSRAQLTPERLGADLDWWAERLAGHPALSAFEADRAPEERAAGASVSFLWDPELSAAIHALARDQRATLYMCLVAAAAAALHVHTGQDDIVLGSPAALRERAELEGVIGPFVNTLALRLAVEPGCNFADMVARARDAVLDAHAHGAVPFEMVVDRVQPARSFNRSPLFQVAVVLQNAGAGQSAPIYGGGAVHDMTWFVREDGGQIMGAIEYRADLYDEATIRRILERIRMLLAGAVTDPTLALSRLPLLSEDERATVLAHAADAPVETDPAPFPLQFQRAAAEFGGRVAIACGDAALTYAALEARANRIAHHLRGLGIGRGAVVGLCMARSAEMVAALIGIQKAGAAYVPLDPAFPADRLAYVLEDSGAAALIADPRGLGRLSLPEGLALVDLEAAAGALDALPDTPPEDPPAPGDRSHIIYTSGSTGRPKGVAIGHAAVANLYGAIREEPGLTGADIVAATTTVSFDIAAVELLIPLTVGARIALLDREVATDGFALAEALERTGATLVQATPSAWRMLLEAGWKGGDHVRAISGGEPLTRDLADRLLERVGALWNGYGPSETTIYSTGSPIGEGAEAIAIGRPVANTRVYVLDAEQRPVPVGLIGEICIGGAGVAEGYVGMPEATAERFLPDPFAPPHAPEGGRLYRTGDLGRWSAEGQLYHLGRADHQVKIRGVRIELGEVEAVLLALAEVRQAVAVVRDAGRDDRRLVAYLVFEPGEELTASEVRRALRARLPAYMVPSVIVDLPALPLTPNGKLDRKALPDPYAASLERAEFVPPAPGLESTLARIWGELLQIERIGAEDNFFELGGHSLLTLRVVRQLEAELGLWLDPRAMFFQNLRQIAARLARDLPKDRAASA